MTLYQAMCRKYGFWPDHRSPFPLGLVMPPLEKEQQEKETEG